MQNVIYWFRNDLRLHDNEGLVRAKEAGNVIPVYIFDEANFKKNHLQLPRTGSFRAKFLIESVIDLKQNLQKIGSDLVIRIGNPVEILHQMAIESNAVAIYASKEVTQEETDIEANLTKNLKPENIDLELIWISTLYHARDLPFQLNSLPNVFTEFRKLLEKVTKVRPTFATIDSLPPIQNIDVGKIPTLEELGLEEPVFDKRSVLEFRGGETEGLKHLDNYIWQKDLLKSYKETRNGLIGSDYSSKLSAWLNLGCISPRKVYEEVKRYEVERIANDSTYWLIFELIWRDYFIFVALKFGTRLFKASGIQMNLQKKWKRDYELFSKWANGETGVAFVDANMRELNATGFMSNRGRQNVASYLSKDLGIDWTWGASYFESKLIDYDVCSNWGNWNYVAGVGNDPREDRYFNIEKQASIYDPEGEYVRLWLS